LGVEAIEVSDEQGKLRKTLREFEQYIAANRPFIPNYGDRYRNGETISSAFVESTVNQVVSKRFVKKQQMRWTKRGAHLLLQVRTRTLNNDLRRNISPMVSPHASGRVAPVLFYSPSLTSK
jgi:hypothetical protein